MEDEYMTDWQQCGAWLVRCSVLNDEQLERIEEDVQCLVQALRDGVLLCRLLNQLHPGSIEAKNFSQRPQTSLFLYLKNIRVFLQTCKKVFGVKDGDLFEPYDLVEARDFSKVIHTLSVLSRTKEAKKSGIPPFVAEREEIYEINSINDIEGDCIYKNIDDDFDDDYEDVYGTLVESTFTTQEPVRAQLSKRDRCVMELIDTERNYLNVLQLLVEKFMKPLRNSMKESDFQIIFRHIEKLYEIHGGFFKQLEATKKPNSGWTIARCFNEWKLKFVIYGDFCSNLIQAQQLLERLCKADKQLEALITTLNNEANELRFRLVELLTVPMQRILKYHLLLKELVKNTEENHPEIKDLNGALDEMQDLSLYVNEVKRDNENMELIHEIQRSITNLQKYMPVGVELSDYGKHLFDGELRLRLPSETSFVPRYIFLFEKVLLACKSKGDTYAYREFLVINHHYMASSEEATTKQAQNTFVLKEQHTDVARQKSYMFAAKSQELMQRWKDSIELAMENVQPTGARTEQNEFKLVTFKEPTICTVCKKLLRGIVFQGYRCKKTDACVHKECIAKINASSTSRALPVRGLPQAPRRELPLPNKPDAPAKPPVQPKPISPNPDTQKPQPDQSDLIRHHPHPPMVTGIPDKRGRRSRHPKSQMFDELTRYPWFSGPMSRPQARNLLENAADGTFLVRIRMEDKGESAAAAAASNDHKNLALSVKCPGQPIKHICIQKSEAGEFFLASGKVFGSVALLVEFYQNNSLESSFPLVQTMLLTPCPQTSARPAEPGCTFCRALYSFSARNTRELSLNENDRIEVTKKISDQWWKGKIIGTDRVGLFPCSYVEEI